MAVDRQPGLERRHGWALVAILTVYALGALAGGWLVVFAWVDSVDHGQDVPVELVLGATSVLLQAVAVVALWRWHKWGLYLAGFLVLAGLALDIAVGTPALVVSVRIVLFGTLVFIVVPYWDRMVD